MSQIKQLLLLHQQGKGRKTIARILGMSKNTVRSYLGSVAFMDNSVVKFRRLAMCKKSKKYSNKLKCNRCGSVIQYRSEVSIVQCRCRYVVVADIDCPEKSQAYGLEAKAFVLGPVEGLLSFEEKLMLTT